MKSIKSESGPYEKISPHHPFQIASRLMSVGPAPQQMTTLLSSESQPVGAWRLNCLLQRHTYISGKACGLRKGNIGQSHLIL
ncbi:Uncharacterized protein TCM_013944 [Theobroma cacao]|uniref:Uncharacterized protein n=1 Tax=Theobroma cacao TaxID=3641 RepID=A0A061FXN0_THECC|nr:Uncharacterized protein TCM_013944 [Theobroma cacao]